MRLINAYELDLYFDKRLTFEAHRNHAYLKGVRDCRKDLANAPTIEIATHKEDQNGREENA